MKGRTKFILAVVLLFVVFLVAEYRMPRKFDWKPTFAHTDPQPFGCMVFDSVLSATMPMGYTVERRTLWQMEHDTVATAKRAFLIIANEDIDAIIPTALRMAKQGNTIIVATIYIHEWTDTLGIDFRYNGSFNISSISGKAAKKGHLRWENDTLSHRGEEPVELPVYDLMVERGLDIPDSVKHTVLASYMPPDDDDSDFSSASYLPPVAAAFPMGEGELILVSAPLLLTNYMMVSGDGHKFIAHLMDRVKHLPVVRTESYMSATAQTEQSPLYVLLREAPLRWAVYLAAITLLLFCIFTARRRQRAIPVITKPRNGNLEFVKLIGTLAWQQHDNASLLARKLTYTAEELRRQTGIDIGATGTNGTHEPYGTYKSYETHKSYETYGVGASVLQQLAAQTGRDPEELRLLLKNIHDAANGLSPLSDEQLKVFIDELDNLIKP